MTHDEQLHRHSLEPQDPQDLLEPSPSFVFIRPFVLAKALCPTRLPLFVATPFVRLDVIPLSCPCPLFATGLFSSCRSTSLSPSYKSELQFFISVPSETVSSSLPQLWSASVVLAPHTVGRLVEDVTLTKEDCSVSVRRRELLLPRYGQKYMVTPSALLNHWHWQHLRGTEKVRYLRSSQLRKFSLT